MVIEHPFLIEVRKSQLVEVLKVDRGTLLGKIRRVSEGEKKTKKKTKSRKADLNN